jgi:transcriptional regulator with XRE-family HTH domain
MLQQDIAEQYGLNRNTVRKIWQGKIVPLSNYEESLTKIQEKIIKNETDNTKITPQQKTSIGKRALNKEEVLGLSKDDQWHLNEIKRLLKTREV